jgi:Phage tail tube protein, GTA-gp10
VTGAAANALRGEAELRVGGEVYRLRPTFAALVAAETELGPLFALAERAADGGLALAEVAALLWHCIEGRPEGVTRDAVGEAVVGAGLVAVTPVLRRVLMQILQGR